MRSETSPQLVSEPSLKGRFFIADELLRAKRAYSHLTAILFAHDFSAPLASFRSPTHLLLPDKRHRRRWFQASQRARTPAVRQGLLEFDVQTRQFSNDLAIGSKARRTGGTTLGTQGDGFRQGPTRS